MVDPIITTLTSVGLTDKEARIFTALLSKGQGTVSEIAELAGIKRSIAYFTLKSLLQRGFAQELPKQKVKRYLAVPPSRLLQFVQGNVENLRLMLPLLRGLHQDHGNKPSLEFYEGKEAALSVYRSMEFGKKSYYLSNWNKLSEFFPEEVKRWSVNASNPKNPNEVKNLAVDDRDGRAMANKMKGNQKQEFRFLSKATTFDMNFGISDNIVAITSFDPLFLVVIHSAQIAACARLLFELAWEGAPKSV